MEKFIHADHNVSEIVLACFVPPNTGETVHKMRPSHGLAMNCEGEKRYVFSDGTTYTVKQNDLIYLPKNSSYVVETPAAGGTYCINFQLSQDVDFSPFSFHLKNADDVLHAYKNAEKVWRRKKTGFAFLCKSELYKILYALHSGYDLPYAAQSKQALLSPALSYIHKHYAEEGINVEKLSELCGFSYEYFRRLFHTFYGCSPIKYINDLKLKRAKELLTSGMYSVSEAAFSSGFSDTSHFSRFFKKNVGVSPNEYRQNK